MKVEVITLSGALHLVTGDTWSGEGEEQGNTAVLALITCVALWLGLKVMELIAVPEWGLGGKRAGASGALTLLLGVTWAGVTCWAEMRGGGGRGYTRGPGLAQVQRNKSAWAGVVK